ncbi:MAG: mprA, partial [Bacteroidetes bacterium]|nr:mprA [Bacteroidota bacterium]
LKLKNGVRSRNEKNIFTLGNYHFDAERLVLQFDSKLWNLTAREAQILQLLCENRGEIVKRDDILENIWGTSDFYTSRSLDVFIKKLRTYLSADPSISIRTVKCVGLILS